MALKGKKKSRSRGSQARRRPASAPRPAYGTREKRRWYQTTSGLVIGFIVVMTVAIFILWFTADQRSETEALETQKEQLDDFTGQLRGLGDGITPVATELSTAADLDDAELEKKATEWKNTLSQSQTAVAQLLPPEGLSVANSLLTQSILLYVQSAEEYALLPELEGKTRDDVAAKAASSFSAANSIYASVIELLDAEREEADMNASGLATPGTGAAPTGEMPAGTDELEIPSEEGDE